MNKNKVFSIILSVMLLNSGQSFCSGSLYEGNIISRYMHRAYKASPVWMTDFVASISNYLPSRQVMGGALSAAVLSYLIYRKYYGGNPPKPESESTQQKSGNPAKRGKPDAIRLPQAKDVSLESGEMREITHYYLDNLDAPTNRLNIKWCLERFDPYNHNFGYNHNAKEACKEAVCPVLGKFCSNYSQDQWIAFSDKVISSYPLTSPYVKQWGHAKGMLLKLKILMEKSCPGNKALPSLKNAVQNCASITEELVKDNPDLIKFSDFQQGSHNKSFNVFAAEIKKERLHIRQ